MLRNFRREMKLIFPRETDLDTSVIFIPYIERKNDQVSSINPRKNRIWGLEEVPTLQMTL